MAEQKTFPVWETLVLGQYPDYETYTGVLASAGIGIRDTAYEILRKMRCAKVKSEVDIVRIYAGREGFSGDLGFRQAVTRAEFYRRALDVGLELCPLEVAPALRLAYRTRNSSDEGTLIAIEPVMAGRPRNFSVPSLYNDCGAICINGWPVDSPHAYWSLKTEWAFVQPRR